MKGQKVSDNTVKISWSGNNYELEYDGDMSMIDVIKVLNQALMILVQDNKDPISINKIYDEWLKGNQN